MIGPNLSTAAGDGDLDNGYRLMGDANPFFVGCVGLCLGVKYRQRGWNFVLQGAEGCTGWVLASELLVLGPE